VKKTEQLIIIIVFFVIDLIFEIPWGSYATEGNNNIRECQFLFPRLSVMIQRFNAIL